MLNSKKDVTKSRDKFMGLGLKIDTFDKSVN